MELEFKEPLYVNIENEISWLFTNYFVIYFCNLFLVKC